MDCEGSVKNCKKPASCKIHDILLNACYTMIEEMSFSDTGWHHFWQVYFPIFMSLFLCICLLVIQGSEDWLHYEIYATKCMTPYDWGRTDVHYQMYAAKCTTHSDLRAQFWELNIWLQRLRTRLRSIGWLRWVGSSKIIRLCCRISSLL